MCSGGGGALAAVLRSHPPHRSRGPSLSTRAPMRRGPPSRRQSCGHRSPRSPTTCRTTPAARCTRTRSSDREPPWRGWPRAARSKAWARCRRGSGASTRRARPERGRTPRRSRRRSTRRPSRSSAAGRPRGRSRPSAGRRWWRFSRAQTSRRAARGGGCSRPSRGPARRPRAAR